MSKLPQGGGEYPPGSLDYLGLEADIIKITDHKEIMIYPIPSTPGLVINEKVICSGQIPQMEEITTWLADAELAANPEG